MAATFPGGVKVFTTKQAGDQIASAHINDIQDEVVAIETELRKTTGSVVSHGSLAGLSNNDHPQYLLAATGKAADSDKLDGIDSTGFATAGHNHDEIYAKKGEAGITDHGLLDGLADNDHPQYLLTTGKAADSDKLDGVDITAFKGLNSLADPNADRVLFWDESAGALKWLTLGTGLSITDTTIKPVLSSVKVQRTSTQSIPNDTNTIVQWTTESWDTDNYADLSTENTKLIIPKSGIYRVYAAMDFAGNSTGIRAIHLLVNGVHTINIGFPNFGSFTPTSMFIPSIDLQLGADDYIQVRVYQSSGSALNIITTYAYPCFGATFVGVLP